MYQAHQHRSLQRRLAILVAMGKVIIARVETEIVRQTVRPCKFVTETGLRTLLGMSAQEYVQRFGMQRRVNSQGTYLYAISRRDWDFKLEKRVATCLWFERP